MRSIDLPAPQNVNSSDISIGDARLIYRPMRSFAMRACIIALPLLCPGPFDLSLHTSGSLLMAQANVGSASGKLFVAESVMASQRTTIVTPQFPFGAPKGANDSLEVVLRVMIKRTGVPTPMFLVSGNKALENEAMNAVRLWRYRPYMRDGVPIDVVTDVRVRFVPGHPAGMVTHPQR